MEYQTVKEEAKPSEPLSFMDTCLQNLHVNGDSSKSDRNEIRNVGPNSSLVIAQSDSENHSNDGTKRKVTFAVA